MFLMKRISKIASFLLVASMAISGCSGGTGTTNETKSVPANAASDATQSSTSAESDNTVTSTGGKTKIVYGGWEGPIMASYMAEQFMAENPDIEVEIFNNGEWLGNENMAKLVAANQMPDIINLENPVYPLQNNWVIDLKPFIDSEEGELGIPENFIKYGTFNDKVIMIPNAVFVYGIMVNKDLLAANNIEIPGYDWTMDEFIDIAKKTTKKGVSVGTTEVNPIMKHYPAQLNDDLGWAAFNEVTQQYQLSPEWVEAANIAYDLYRAGASVYERLDENGNPWDYEEGSTDRAKIEEARANFLQDLIGEDETWQGWLKGKVATYLEFSWNMKWDNLDSNPAYSGFGWDFYPFPTKTKDDVSRPGIVIDSVGITTKCANPEAAWKFLKYITFDKNGVEARFDIINNYSKAEAQQKFPQFAESQYPETLTFTHMPCTVDQDVINTWAEFNDAPGGIKYMMGNMDLGFVDGFKVTPGYDEAYHKTIEKTFKEQVYTGQKSASDIVDEVTSIANDITTKAYAALK